MRENICMHGLISCLRCHWNPYNFKHQWIKYQRAIQMKCHIFIALCLFKCMCFIKNVKLQTTDLYIIKCVSVPASVRGMTVPICLKAGGVSSRCVRSMDIQFQLFTSSRTTPPSRKMTTPMSPIALSPSPTLSHVMVVCTHVLLTMESLTSPLVMHWFIVVS